MKFLNEVLIIDDSIEEAEELKKLFIAKNIVPKIIEYTEIRSEMHFNPDIICCDIMLNTTGNEELNFKTIAGILKRVLNYKKEYVFIAWTSGDQKLFTRLKQFLTKDSELHQPIKFYCFKKNNFNLDKLEKNITKIRTEIQGLDILQYWRLNMNTAIESTISELFELSKKKNIKIIDILKMLADKTYGKNIKDNESKALNTYLQYILRDNIEKRMSESQEDIVRSLSTPYKNTKKYKKYELDAILNSSLHIDTIEFIGQSIYPGSFYTIENNKIWENIFGNKVLTNNSYTEDKCKKEKNKIINQALKNSTKLKTDAQKGKRKNKIESVYDKIVWGIVDITADCDFSNNKSQLNKCILAFLTPLNQDHLEPELSASPSYVKYKIAIKTENGYDFYWLIMCSKYLLGIRKELVKSENSFKFRIRDTLLTSIRKDVFDYNSRIGTISF